MLTRRRSGEQGQEAKAPGPANDAAPWDNRGKRQKAPGPANDAAPWATEAQLRGFLA